MKSKITILSVICVLFAITSCTPAFVLTPLDSKTGRFPTSIEVNEKDIKIFQPFGGIHEAKYVYIRGTSSSPNETFYIFMKDALMKIGFKEVISSVELSHLIIQSGLSSQVTNISDLISLNTLAKKTGPYLIVEARITRVGDATYAFNLQIIDPLTLQTYLNISRVRTNYLLGMDKEINFPVLNVIKQWYEDSVKYPHKKNENTPGKKEQI